MAHLVELATILEPVGRGQHFPRPRGQSTRVQFEWCRSLLQTGAEKPVMWDMRRQKLIGWIVLICAVAQLGQRADAQEASGANRKEARVKAGARNLSLAFRSASDKALPSVVKILSKSKADNEGSSILDIIGGEDSQLFDSVGSGVIVSKDGLILTNHHVIRDSVRIEVRLPDGREFDVAETKSDPRSDIALIRIDVEEDLPAAVLANSDEVYVGDWVLAIGSPFMLDASVSAGIISGTGRRRQLSRTVSGQFLQTDAAINPGNSGGPLVNLDGQVVGINTAISSRTGGFQGIGFAVPISRAEWIMKELLEYDKVRRGWVGVRTSNVRYEMAKQMELPRFSGAMVNNVVPNYPGDKAGLQAQDVIVEFAGQYIESAADFAEVVQQSPIGVPLELVVIRDGEQLTLSIELQERP